MKKTDTMSARHMLFLEKVFDRRDILFKKGTNTNGNIHAKEEEWEQIRRECVDAGYFELRDKSFRHLRDITWQNFRRRAVAKLDMVRKGGKDVEQLTDSDKLVLAIIGNVQLSPIPTNNASNNHLPTQVVVDEELEEEPQVSGEIFNVKTEPIDFLPLISGQSFASFFDTRSNGAQSESTDEQPVVLENDNRNLSARRPLFEDDDELDAPTNNARITSSSLGKISNLKRKRQLADIRYRDAETERMLAEAEKLRAEAILIRLQATEVELRIKQISGGEKGATTLITDGEQL